MTEAPYVQAIPRRRDLDVSWRKFGEQACGPFGEEITVEDMVEIETDKAVSVKYEAEAGARARGMSLGEVRPGRRIRNRSRSPSNRERPLRLSVSDPAVPREELGGDYAGESFTVRGVPTFRRAVFNVRSTEWRDRA